MFVRAPLRKHPFTVPFEVATSRGIKGVAGPAYAIYHGRTINCGGGGRGERREATIKAREKVGERCKGAQVGGKTSGKTGRWASLHFCPLTWGAEILEAINIVAIRERGL